MLHLINLMGNYQEDVDFGALYTSEGTNEFGEYEIVPQTCPSVKFTTELKTVFHDLYFITTGEYRAVESLLEKIDACLEAKPGGSKQLQRLSDELGELYYTLKLKYLEKPRVEGGKQEDEGKTLNSVKFNMWRNGEHSIALKVFNPFTGEGKLTSVEHTQQRSGKEMKRTHNDLYFKLKELLEDADKWDVPYEK